MAKVNFTGARVEAHRCASGTAQSFLWDSDTPGLGLRTTAAGTKSYIFQSKFRGSTIRMTIGSPASWPLESQYKKGLDGEREEAVRGARQEARRLQNLIDRGIDPRVAAANDRAAHEAQHAEARRRTLTVGEVWDVYVEARRPRWGERHYRDHVFYADEGGKERKRGKGLTVPGPLAPLRHVRLCDLTSERIASWLEAEANVRPTMAALSFRLLRGFMRWTDDTPAYRGVVPTDTYKRAALKTRCVREPKKAMCCSASNCQRGSVRSDGSAIR